MNKFKSICFRESDERYSHEDYEKWINNFTLNLENIWKENSAGELMYYK